MSEGPLYTVCTHGDKLRLDTDDWVEGSTLAWGMVAFSDGQASSVQGHLAHKKSHPP